MANTAVVESALVTGASQGIGRAIARKLASRGISVLIVDIKDEAGQQAAAAIAQDFGVDAAFYHADMTREEDIKNMVDCAVARWGRLDWAVNNAGAGEMLESDEDSMSAADFDRLAALDQRGVWLCQKYEATQMRKQELRLPNGVNPETGGVRHRGAIVNVASMCGHAATGMPSYTAAKHAVLGITKCGGMFYGPFGIRCNAISPGPVTSPEFFRFLENHEYYAKQANGWRDRCPLKRWSNCDEQANVASFLLSGESSFINGTDILVDGGLTNVINSY